MRLAVVLVMLVIVLAARFELSIRSGAGGERPAAAGGFAIDLRLGGALAGLRP